MVTGISGIVGVDHPLVLGISGSVDGGLSACPALLAWSFRECLGTTLLMRFKSLLFDIFVGRTKVRVYLSVPPDVPKSCWGRNVALIVDLARSSNHLRVDPRDVMRRVPKGIKKLCREGIRSAEFFSIKLSTEFGLEEPNWLSTTWN